MKIKLQTALFLVIAALVVVTCIQQCELQKCHEANQSVKADTIRTVDTVYITRDTVIVSKPRITATLPPSVIPDSYIPTNCDSLSKRYQELLQAYFSSNLYQDTVRIDSSMLVVSDTVTRNLITGRKYQAFFKIPKITETITVTKQTAPTRQLYIGGGLQTNQNFQPSGVSGGLLYKSKKDWIVNATVTATKDGTLVYSANTYFKIKLK